MPETLRERIIRHILMSGPLPLAEYMHWCMADNESGYYQHADAIGRAGDFITAPEISQMFGELIGVWAINAWHQLGSPGEFNLVELGPGRGTLMKDLLRAGKVSEGFYSAAKISLIETSEKLEKQQRETLQAHQNVLWHRSIDDAPKLPSIVIGNEFLDVLPVRQYVKSSDQWHERVVGLDEDEELTWQLGPSVLQPELLPCGHEKEPDGSVFEISPTREAFIVKTAELLKRNGGAALFVDYGHTTSGFGDTFQAIRAHEHVDTLAEPGKADLTSHVDFDALGKIVSEHKLNCHPVLSQGEFLLSLGLLERAGNLGMDKDQDTQQRLKGEAERLALPDQMGSLFKAFAFSTFPDLHPFPRDT